MSAGPREFALAAELGFKTAVAHDAAGCDASPATPNN